MSIRTSTVILASVTMVVLALSVPAALRNWEKRLRATVARTFEDETEKQDASVADRQGLGIGEEKTI